jgi:hypothetical protein
MSVHRGRDVRQWAAFTPRTTSAVAPSWVSTRGDAHAMPRRTATLTSIEGAARRTSAAVRPSGASARTASTSARARSSQASPSPAIPAVTTSLTIRARSERATRADALGQVALSKSRGNTKTVRRMANCLTRLRSSCRPRSTSAMVTEVQRARHDRWTVAGSVA